MAENSVDDYREFSPTRLQELVHSLVHITLEEGEELSGWVYTIDPVTHTIVIAPESAEDDGKSSQQSVVFVMANAVKQLKLVETTEKQPEWLKDFARKKKRDYSPVELRERKAKVIEWLQENRVPIHADSAETEDVRVLGRLVIEPPYDVDSCKGTNEIVLERIRKLLGSMPRD